MPVIGIKYLAEVVIEQLAPEYGFDPAQIKINIIGAKPGEKLYEELMTDEGAGRAIELDRYFVVKPAIMKRILDINYSFDGVISEVVTNTYNCAN
ncbi:MAG: FlaA1/EpsC-like NDP-sugar epimerase [Pseudohongiellaceae bacterium]|jgi:FlaA1/EpsC-like NDP-sugar epimerase